MMVGLLVGGAWARKGSSHASRITNHASRTDSISYGGVNTMSSMTEAAPVVATTYPYFTEEHDMFRQTVKHFVQAEIAPHAEEWDEAGIFPKELFKKAADLGLFGIRLDPKYG